MFATIKSLIPEPRQADQPRRYVGRHRQPEPELLENGETTVNAKEPPVNEEPVPVGMEQQTA